MPASKFKVKKRPRRFFGTPNHLGRKARSPPHCQEAGRSEETPEEMPIPAKTAKSQFLKVFEHQVDPSEMKQSLHSPALLLLSLKLLILSLLRR